MSASPIIVWFRRDLRLADNPALNYAVNSGAPVLAVYIDETEAGRTPGAATKWWLHYSLQNLSSDLHKLGGRLILRRGEPRAVLPEMAERSETTEIVWNRRYTLAERTLDAEIKREFGDRGIDVKSFNGALLTEPWEVKTGGGSYYKVFTPYWRAAQDHLDRSSPLPAPANIRGFDEDVDSLSLSDLNLLPTKPDWGAKMKPYWTPGESGAHDALEDFLSGPVTSYAQDRDRPDKPNGTSRLSPHLAFGEISPRQIRAACADAEGDIQKFMSEVGWREFSYQLLYYNPDLASENFRSDFDSFGWRNDPDWRTAWRKGETGYPFVDAGMRELWATGYMHNRVRMVTASFLIKHLLQDWRHGEKWFWDTLVDADPANNAASWQWVAGSGADASPYFRIFNPMTQGEKFDPSGEYVRRWVPEIAALPDKYIHRPWEAPEDVLETADIRLGETYPSPIVDHKIARERALSAYKQSRETGA